ncbi:hypothetical protein [Bradyrhizobium sp. USDA 4501]
MLKGKRRRNDAVTKYPPRYESTRSYMQAPAERVNMATSGRAPAVLRFGSPGGPALAIIAIGLAVAAAYGLEDLVADRRAERAGAGLVEAAAGHGLELAELAATAALQSGKAAAGPAEAGGIGRRSGSRSTRPAPRTRRKALSS